MNRFFIAVILLLTSLIFGIAGFMWVENYTIPEAFYMTIITLSTVGFGEVRPLSEGGRIFTSVYIMVNLGIFAYVVSVISSYLFEGELRRIYNDFVTGRTVKKMKNHVIVCGFGRNGTKACEELERSGSPFIIVDTTPDNVNAHPAYQHYQIVVGDATLDDTLKAARIEKALTIITTLPRDSDNVFIALTAKELNPNIKVIARASETNSEKKLLRAGADHIVMPDALGGIHMARLITRPYAIEFLELLNGVGEDRLVLEDIPVTELKSEYQGQTILDLDIRRTTRATVIAVKEKGSGFIFNPQANVRLNSNDVMIILGTDAELKKFRRHYL